MKKITFITLLIFSSISPQSVFADEAQHIVYADVNGLVCDFCARALEKVFDKQTEVASIKVDLDAKVITIHMKKDQRLTDEKVTKLITDSGYNVRAIRHAP